LPLPCAAQRSALVPVRRPVVREQRGPCPCAKVLPCANCLAQGIRPCGASTYGKKTSPAPTTPPLAQRSPLPGMGRPPTTPRLTLHEAASEIEPDNTRSSQLGPRGGHGAEPAGQARRGEP